MVYLRDYPVLVQPEEGRRLAPPPRCMESALTHQYLATVADILTDAGHYLWHHGNILDAKGFLEQAEAICLSVPEDMSASTRASALVGLVAVGHTAGFSMRDKIIEQNLEIVRLRTGYRAGVDAETAEILLSNAWHDLGCTYMEASEYVKAEECLDRSLGIKTAVGTEVSMPFEFATEYEDMA
ncbi:hypothetical protein GE09DRAFT_1220898 [Coniochaeta sp. 2T2.1]|nr:hypothetical protein GE09DRAFT_1220898 [Coniochaeta sp. 2T2.1]